MSTAAQTNELSLTMIIDLTKENALALYGRSMTYSIITTCPQSRGSTLATQKYDGHKIHALLIGYSIADPGRGKLLRGAYTQGSGRTPPTVACALRLLFDETRRDVLGFVGRWIGRIFGACGG
ncbi:hypothetical protein CC86DRAFT_369591 [Ophiobolus disseminans]|uniref:Uncharacterized protein n=1 Tax=Ophiobolus disseminans TaxID=1469910 RepID=A0A6A7A3V9_9PLEO|nr:hypothetical protein CC86DRAFT_369591 [Ophiobolus disseminans]